MDLQEFLKQGWVIYAAVAAARVIPRWTGYRLSQLAASRIARNRSRVYLQMRENLAHFPGTDDDPGKLDKLTQQSFINAGRYYFDFYRTIGLRVKAVGRRTHIPDSI